MLRKIISIIIYLFLFLSIISGCSSAFGFFKGSSNVVTQDYSGLQKKAEYFSTIFLDWNKPLKERQDQMLNIAPDVVPYLVSGKQAVQYVESGVPYFSGERGYVDVTALVKGVKIVDGADATFYRNYKLTVFFIQDKNGNYVVERMPQLGSVSAPPALEVAGMDKEQRGVATALEPTLEVFMPAFLSGDLRSVQTLIKDDSEIKSFNAEYEYLAIKEIHVRAPSDKKKADYAADVVLKVKDVELNQITYISVYVWVKEDGDKFYVVRANL